MQGVLSAPPPKAAKRIACSSDFLTFSLRNVKSIKKENTFLPSPWGLSKASGFFYWSENGRRKGEYVARRNQNTFIKRQKELKRVRKAKEKMARRQGKKVEDTHTFEGPLPESVSPEDDSASATELEKIADPGT